MSQSVCACDVITARPGTIVTGAVIVSVTEEQRLFLCAYQ